MYLFNLEILVTTMGFCLSNPKRSLASQLTILLVGFGFLTTVLFSAASIIGIWWIGDQVANVDGFIFIQCFDD